MRYALIITLEAPNHANLYNDIWRTYANILVPIQPSVSLPMRVHVFLYDQRAWAIRHSAWLK